jgi:hypothetical protein
MATKYIDKLIHHSYFDPESGIVWREIVARWGQADYDDLTKRKEHQDTLKLEWDAQDYARNRQTEYPAIGDQLDEIYHNGIDSWKTVIKVTKDKYPKG